VGADLENLVTSAEGQGGWLPLVFHHICDNDCNAYSISTADFSAFLNWLQTREYDSRRPHAPCHSVSWIVRT